MGKLLSEMEASSFKLGEMSPDSSKLREELTPTFCLFPKEIPREILPDFDKDVPPNKSFMS